MKKFAIPALAVSLALGACEDNSTPAEEAAPVEETTVVTPTATETVVVDDGAEVTVGTEGGSSVTVDGKDVDATVGEDGVKAEVKVD